MFMKHVLTAVSLAVVSLVDNVAFAQQAQQEPRAEVTALDKVVVTSQRRTESAQDVGLAVSVLSGSELTSRGISNVNQLQNEVPSLEVEPAFGSGQSQFRIRGIGFQDYGPNNTSPVSVYVDEVAFGFPVQTQGLLFDLERVEVLRGPQGTLYGQNTTGGAINFITKKPTKDFEFGYSVGVGSYNAKTAQAYVSGSISDSLRGRVAFSTEQGGAWQKNRETGEKLGNKNVLGVRGQLDLDATRDLKFNLSYSYGRDKSDVEGLYLFTARPSYGYGADTDRKLTGWGITDTFANLIGVSADAKPHRDNTSNNVALTANWDLGATKLTSITAYQHFDRAELGDWDATSVNNADVYWQDAADVFSQELRLASNTQGDLNWVTGLYYTTSKLAEDWYSDFTRDYGAITRTKYDQKTETSAIFGQLDYKLKPDLKLIAGLRQEHDHRAINNFSTSAIPDQVWASVSGASQSLSTDGTSGKLGLEYQVAPKSLVYGSISRGIKSGGITAHNTFNTLALTPFKPETLVSFEVGVKSDIDTNLRVNAALFHYEYRNQQFQDVTTSSSGALVGKIINIDKSHVDGGEVELLWRPLPGLTIGQSLGYKRAVFDDFNSPLLGNLSGKEQFLPKLSYGGSISYTWAYNDFQFKAAGDYSYRSVTHSWLNLLNPDGGSTYDIPAYWLANARIEVGKADSPWQVAFSVQNLFNQKYDLTRNFFGNRTGGTLDDLNVAAAGKPRTFGVTLSYAY